MSNPDLSTLIELFRTVPVVEALAAAEQRYPSTVRRLEIWVWDHQRAVLQALRTSDAIIPRAERDISFRDELTVSIEVLGDDLGVLAAKPVSEETASATQELLQLLAPIVALSIRSNEPALDTIPVRRRRREMSLPAEIQWSLLPPTDLEAGSISLSAAVEPAYETGGDVFDYALDDGSLFLCVLDAMGHGLRASLMSTLAVSALRRARRNGAALAEMAAEVAASVTAAAGDGFVSAVMVELDLRSWQGTWLSAGHEPPLIVGADRRLRQLDLVPALPLGMEIGGNQSEPEAQPLGLAPGETLILYSDGIVENAAIDDHQPLGEARFHAALDAELDQGGSSVARRVVERLMSQTGPALRDDATLLVVRRLLDARLVSP